MEIFFAILQRSYYNKDKFCSKLVFRRKRQKRRMTFKKKKERKRNGKILISPSKYLQGAGEMKTSEHMRQNAERKHWF